MYRILLCIVLGLAGSTLHAANTLTLDQALTLADRSHPLLQASSAQVDAAKAGITTAKAYPNPEANFLAGRQTGAMPLAPAPLYAFSQSLELGALRPSRIQLAERGRESSEFFSAQVRLAVLSGVRRSFFQVLRRKAEIGVAAENLKLVDDLRARVKVRVDVGESGRLELLRAEAEQAIARTASNSAQLQLVTALNQFRAAVGGGLEANVEIDGSLENPGMLPPLSQLHQEALDRHPALSLLRSEVKRADARVTYEIAQRRPQPAVKFEMDSTNPSYRAGLGIPLPFWNRREGPIAEARASQRQSGYLSQSREIEILAELDAAYGRYEVADQQVAVYESGLLAEAEGALRASEAAFQLGEREIIEVLDAQRVVRTIRMDYLGAQYDRQSALVDLQELRAEDLQRTIP